MPDWLSATEPGTVTLDVGAVALRLGVAAMLGSIVALLFRLSRRPAERTPGLAPTLVLLAPLIAMVMMAVGTNVAAAFTLVGTLAIVRFRTAVRDTRDTVYVIFAVAVGMSAGVLNLVVALVGTGVVGGLILGLRLLEQRTRIGVDGRAASLRLVVSPPDPDPTIYREVVLRYARSVEVVRCAVDRATGELNLRLALTGTDPATAPELLGALLEVPEVVRAQYAPEAAEE